MTVCNRLETAFISRPCKLQLLWSLLLLLHVCVNLLTAHWEMLIVNCQQADAHNTTTTNKKLAVDFLEKSFNGCFANYSIGDSDKCSLRLGTITI